LELTVGYCAVGVKRRSSWQLFSECGIACWGRRQSRFRDLWSELKCHLYAGY